MSDPDELCQICDISRENHGDAHHKFSVDGVLVKLDPPSPPRQQAPAHRDDAKMSGNNTSVADAVTMQHNMSMRFIERLVDKGILDAKDVLHILGGSNAVLSDSSSTQEA